MKKEYDFRNAKRGQVVRRKDRTRVTIHLDTDLLEELRRRADAAGRGYQTMINEALREYIGRSDKPVDAATIRRIVREELLKTGQEHSAREWSGGARTRRPMPRNES